MTRRTQGRHHGKIAMIWLPLFVVILAVTWLGSSAGPDSPSFSPAAPRFPFADAFNRGTTTVIDRYDHGRDPAVSLLPEAARPQALVDDCKQLLANPHLDVVNGSIPSWSILEPRVYYSTTTYVSPPSAIVMPEGDDGDPSLKEDAFGQIFTMSSGLTSVTVEFQTRTANANAVDKVFGNLWTVDAGNKLDQFIGGWAVADSADAWAGRKVLVQDSGDLADMAGQKMAIIFFTDANGQAPGEVVYFDDITLTACTGAANTPTATATNGPTQTPTATATNGPTQTPTATPTNGPTQTPTATATDQPGSGHKLFLPVICKPEPPSQPTPTPTATPRETATETPTPTVSPEPTAQPGACPQTGQWSGTTSQGRSISFTVENVSRCQIAAESVKIQIRDSCGFVSTTTFMQSYAIVDNGFQTGSWSATLTWVGGKFSSSSTASGNFNFYSINPYEPWRTCIASGEWTAAP